MKLNIVFVSEAGGVIGGRGCAPGMRAVVFGMINTIADVLESRCEIEESTRSMLLFRRKQTDGSGDIVCIGNKAIKESGRRGDLNVARGYCDGYSNFLTRLTPGNHEASNDFCTEEALQSVIEGRTKRKGELTVLVFMAISSDILSFVRPDAMLIGEENGRQIVPDLSLFFLNDRVPAADAAKLSRLNNGENQVRVYFWRSFVDNIVNLQRRYNLNVEPVTKKAIECRSGIPYSIYGLLADLASQKGGIPGEADTGSGRR